MKNWRTATVLLGLSSLLACAKATYDGEDPFQAAGGAPADNGGAPSGEGGAPASVAGASPTAGAQTGGAGAPHAGATSTGGRSGGGAGATSTGGRSGGTAGATGTAGKGSGGSPGTGGAATGGSGGAAVDGPCADPVDIMGKMSGDVGLAGGCFRTTETFNAIGCSNFTGGRTIKVNGKLDPCAGMKTTFAPMIGGYNYFEVSAGDVTYASFFWFSS